MRNKYDNISDASLTSKIAYWGRVVSITDKYESRTIKVYIPEIDSKSADFEKFSLSSKKKNNFSTALSDSFIDNLPECYPLTPAHFHFVPQLGERVMIIMDRYHDTLKSAQKEKRYYFTTSISKPQNIENDPYDTTASSRESDGTLEAGKAISEIPAAKGAYATKTDIGLVGRKNTDVLLRDGEVLLRAGKHEKNDTTIFNKKDPAYIQIRHGLNNASKEVKKKRVFIEEITPPTHIINVFVSGGKRLEIKIFSFTTNTLVEEFTQTYDNREQLLLAAKEQIAEYQNTETYAKWKLITVDPELSKLEKDFKGYKTIIQKEEIVKDQNEFDQFAGSVVNIVAEKINLLSHKGSNNFELTDPEKMITEDSQLEINTNSHPMVHGDKLIDFLKLVKTFIETHVHPYAGLPTDPDTNVQNITNFNLEDLVDKNIRIG
jgi:hypothetical protein